MSKTPEELLKERMAERNKVVAGEDGEDLEAEADDDFGPAEKPIPKKQEESVAKSPASNAAKPVFDLGHLVNKMTSQQSAVDLAPASEPEKPKKLKIGDKFDAVKDLFGKKAEALNASKKAEELPQKKEVPIKPKESAPPLEVLVGIPEAPPLEASVPTPTAPPLDEPVLKPKVEQLVREASVGVEPKAEQAAFIPPAQPPKPALTELDKGLSELNNFLKDTLKLEREMGSKNAKIFVSKMIDLNNAYNKPGADKTKVLSNGLKDIDAWCKAKTKETEKSVFSKIASIVSLRIKSAFTKGEKSEQYKDEMEQIKQNLHRKKPIIDKLKDIGKHTSAVLDKAKKGSVERGR